MSTNWKDIVIGTVKDLSDGVPPFEIYTKVYIDGIEVNQAIQYYHADQHLTDAADRGDDNSVQLIRNKPALVRVYVRSLFNTLGVAVSGRLEVTRKPKLGEAAVAITVGYDPVAPGTALAFPDPDYADERGDLAATLNFLLPGEQMSGTLILKAEIWRDGKEDEIAATRQIEVAAKLRQTLSLRGILIGYDGPNAAGNANINLAAPTVADLAATAALSLAALPVEAEGEFSSGGTIGWSTPLTGLALNPGGCSQQWLDLNAAIAAAKANDGNRTDVIYYGLLPVGIPIANVGGCASSGVTSGGNGDVVTMAHEVGHALGLAHGPCGTPGDPAYPAYEPYDPPNTPNSVLGEYGVNLNNLEIQFPMARDVMSYCNGGWFSLYHYQKMILVDLLSPRWLQVKQPHIPEIEDPYVFPWEELMPPVPDWEHQFLSRVTPQRLVSLIAIVRRDESVDVRSVMRVRATASQPGAVETGYRLELFGKNGEVLADAPLLRLPSQGGCNCGGGCGGGKDGSGDHRPPFLAQALMPDVAPGAGMRIVRRQPTGGKEERVWERTAPAQPPKLRSVSASVASGRGKIGWAVEARTADHLRYSIQFSKDGGRTWNSVAAGLRGSEYSFDATWLPAGEIVFRVLAHDGFHSASADAKPVQVEETAPLAVLLHPRPRAVFVEGTTMRLWGSTVARGRRDPTAEKFRWRIDGEDLPLRSRDQWIEAPPAGEHKCELIVEGRGGSSSAVASFTTVSRERKG